MTVATTDNVQALVVFDLETTGVDLETARIVTAYIGLVLPDGTIPDGKSKSWLANPGIPIPEHATAVHGVTTEHAAAHGQTPAEAVADIRRLLATLSAKGFPIVAYNARYDITVLDRECRRHGIDPLPQEQLHVIDPFVLDKAIDRYRRGKRTLTATCAHYGVSLANAHDAEADARATGELAWKLLARLPGTALASLHDNQIQAAYEQAASYEQYRRRNGEPDFTAPTAWPLVPAT